MQPTRQFGGKPMGHFPEQDVIFRLNDIHRLCSLPDFGGPMNGLAAKGLTQEIIFGLGGSGERYWNLFRPRRVGLVPFKQIELLRSQIRRPSLLPIQKGKNCQE